MGYVENAHLAPPMMKYHKTVSQIASKTKYMLMANASAMKGSILLMGIVENV